MGCSQSTIENDYLKQLLDDKVPQSVLLDNENAGESKIYRNIKNPSELINYLSSSSLRKIGVKEEVLSLFDDKPLYSLWQIWDNFKCSKKNLLGTRKQLSKTEWGEYEWRSYEDVNSEMEKAARGLMEIGIKPKTKIGILSRNRSEWTILEWACFRVGIIVVPLYDTLGETAIEFILEQAGVKLAFASKETLNNLVRSKEKGGEALKDLKLACFDEEMKSNEVMTWKDLLENGWSSIKPIINPHPDDVSIIMYTSGTTGNPKGVILTQNNIVSAVYGSFAAVALESGDRSFSFLPLAHIYETLHQTICIALGGSFGYYHGDVRALTDDAAKCKPTIFIGVPRVYERVYSVVMAKMALIKGIKAIVVKKAIAEQTRRVQNGLPRNNFYDKKVFNTVKQALGGRVRIFISGAAPLAPHLASFLRVFFSGCISEGFGMTENAAIACIRSEHDPTVANVGPPLPHNEIKLRDVVEMGYLHSDEYPRGEVCIRGPHIFKGYYENEAATKDALSNDGWLYTGDIGRMNPNGTLTIIDRKKNIFKLSQGEYVAIEKIEMAVAKSNLVGQLWAYGDSFQNALVGIVVPDFEKLMLHAQVMNWEEKEYKAIVVAHYAELKALILENMKEMGRKEKLKGFELIYAIELESDINDLKQGFNIENECLTPTFKLKRPSLKAKYADTIDKMYNELARNKTTVLTI